MLPIESRSALLKLSEKEDVAGCSEKLRGKVDVPSAGRGARSGEGELRENEG